MTRVEFVGLDFTVAYHPSKKLRFNTRGLSGNAQACLEKLKVELEVQIKAKDA